MSVGALLHLAIALSGLLVRAGAAIVVFRPAFSAAPRAEATLTPGAPPAPPEVKSCDVLGRAVSRAEAERLPATPEGRRMLSPHEGDAIVVADLRARGMAGTLRRGIRPDPAASLRVLVDRRLRAAAVAANRGNPDLTLANVDGSGPAHWVDEEAGFTVQQQSDLVEFLLSLDDRPPVLPPAPAAPARRGGS